jgi:integrase
MARARKGSDFESANARLKLKMTHHPYWVNVAQGVAVGYRRGPKASTWHVRFHEGLNRTGNGSRYTLRDLGAADDYRDANGETVLTYFQACEKARELAKERDRKLGLGIAEEITVGKAADHYLEWFRAHRKGVDTAERIIEAFIRPAFGDKRVADLKKSAIASWLNGLAAAPARKRTKVGKKQAFRAAPKTEDERRARRATANRTLAVFKAMLNKAADDELIAPRGVWVDVKPFKLADKPVERFLTTAETQRLLNASPVDLRALVRGALLTGCRYSELANMRVADVTIEDNGGRVYVREAKSSKPRFIPLSPEGRSFFGDGIKGKTGNALVFTRADGSQWGRNHSVRPLAAACKSGKIAPGVSFHELRHTYASLLAQGGADLLTISKLLGHADTRITARHYAHLCDKTLANTVDKLLPNFGFKPEDKVADLGRASR